MRSLLFFRASTGLALVLALCALPSCGRPGGGATCAAGITSLDILDPFEGEEITTERYDVRIQTCGVPAEEQIVLRLLQPFVTDYAFVTVPTEDATVVVNIPILPGTMEMQAATRDLSVTSLPVVVTGSPTASP